MPYWLWRLDHVEYRHMRNELGTRIRRPPSEYFARQCYVAFEPGEALLPATAKAPGPGRLVFGSDFPPRSHDRTIVDSRLHSGATEAALFSDQLKAALWLPRRRPAPARATRVPLPGTRPGARASAGRRARRTHPGWLDVDALLTMIPEYQTAIQVNVDVYRLRRLLAAANLVDPDGVVERQPGRLRIGVDRIKVERMG